MFPGCLRGVSEVFLRCFRGVSQVLPGCFRGVSEVFPVCLRGVSRVFPRCFPGASGVRQRGSSPALSGASHPRGWTSAHVNLAPLLRAVKYTSRPSPLRGTGSLGQEIGAHSGELPQQSRVAYGFSKSQMPLWISPINLMKPNPAWHLAFHVGAIRSRWAHERIFRTPLRAGKKSRPTQFRPENVRPRAVRAQLSAQTYWHAARKCPEMCPL